MLRAGHNVAERTGIKAALAVFWSFFGVRKRRDYDQDAQSLTPMQVIVAGLAGGAVFVLTVLLAVYAVLRLLK